MMRIAYISFLLVVAFGCTEEPRISGEQENFYLKVFGGSTTNDCCNAIVADNDNLFLTGSFNYLNGSDMFLIKTDRFGNETEWSPKIYGNQGTEVGNAISTDQNKNIITAGYVQANGANTADFFVVKTSPSGEELWRKNFGGPRDEKAYAVSITRSNITYVAGYTESISFDTKKRQGWVMAISENGDSIWSHDYGTFLANDELRGITEMRDSLLLVGSTQTLFGENLTDVFLFILKKSTRGIENSATLYRIGNQTGVSALFSPSGHVYVLGYTQVNTNVNNIIVWKLEEDLQLVKVQHIVSGVSETPSTLLLRDESLVIVGTAVGEQANDNFLVYVLDAELNVTSRNTYGTTGKGNQRGMTGVISGKQVIIGGCTVSGNSSKASIFKTPPVLP